MASPLGWIVILSGLVYQIHLSTSTVQARERLPMPKGSYAPLIKFAGTTVGKFAGTTVGNQSDVKVTTVEDQPKAKIYVALVSADNSTTTTSSTGIFSSSYAMRKAASTFSYRFPARRVYNATSRKTVISPRTARFRRPIELPGENRATLSKKTSVNKHDLPTALPVFTGLASELKTVFYPTPAATLSLPQFPGNETDGAARFSISHLPGTFDIVQTASAVLTATGNFRIRSLWF
jgi:hypothetical protein